MELKNRAHLRIGEKCFVSDPARVIIPRTYLSQPIVRTYPTHLCEELRCEEAIFCAEWQWCFDCC